MDIKIKEYRNKHHRCKYCKFLRYVHPPFDIACSYRKCCLKDKIIPDLFLWDYRGMFCKWFDLRED